MVGMQNWEDEQQRIDSVVQTAKRQMETLQAQVGQITSDIVDIRKNFWDDVTVNLEDSTETVETLTSIRQQAEVLSEKERNYQRAIKQLKTLSKLVDSPYFGRIDFREDTDTVQEEIYLGVGSIRDARTDTFLVYDWRAPISSLYYDFAPGPAAYETPMGTISGEMALKRQYVIRQGRLVSMFDASMTIGDELLREVLGQNSDTLMRSIVATIQKEQNQIIRNDHSRILIVQGAAGSGKTSAALQRVAYLLYRHRKTLSADNIMLFSPNPMFSSYISTVLPELGEESMRQTTFQDYLQYRLVRGYDIENPFAQLEYVHTAYDTAGYEARIAGIRYKSSLAFMNRMDDFIEQLATSGMVFRSIRFRGEIVISAARIREVFYETDVDWRLYNRLKAVAEWILAELTERVQMEREKPWVEDELQLLEKEDYVRAFRQLRKQKKYTEESFNDFAVEQAYLANVVVERHFKPLRRRVNRMQFVHLSAIYKRMLESMQCPTDVSETDWREMCNDTIERLRENRLGYEDVTPFLYLKDRLEGFRSNASIRHLFVDEAQDYSPFQFAYLKKLFPFSKMTVLGDVNQVIYTESADGVGMRALEALYSPGETETVVLHQSYRSTRPIVEFTRALLENGLDIEPFNRSGDKPRVTTVEGEQDLVACIVRQIRRAEGDGHQTIAIICKTAKETSRAFSNLSAIGISLRQVTIDTVKFEPGIVVIPVVLAKGVEFDAVVVYNASRAQYAEAGDRKLLYTACTRAMHVLSVNSVGEVSPFVAALPKSTYEVEAK